MDVIDAWGFALKVALTFDALRMALIGQRRRLRLAVNRGGLHHRGTAGDWHLWQRGGRDRRKDTRGGLRCLNSCDGGNRRGDLGYARTDNRLFCDSNRKRVHIVYNRSMLAVGSCTTWDCCADSSVDWDCWLGKKCRRG